MLYYPHADAARKVDWADQLPHDVDSIVTEDRVLLYADPAHHLSKATTTSGFGLDDVGNLLDAKESIMDHVAEYGYGDFFADFDLVHRTPLHMIYTLTDDELENVVGDIESWSDVSYDAFNDMFEEMVLALQEEFEATPYAFDSEQIDEVLSPEVNVLVLYCNRAVEISELGLMSHKQAQCYLLQHHGLQQKHIADLLDIEDGTVSSHIGRAKSNIKVAKKEVGQLQEAVSVVEEATGDTTAAVAALEDRIGEVYYYPKDDSYHQVDFGGRLSGGMIGYVLQRVDGDTTFTMDYSLSAYEHVPQEEVPSDVTFDDDPVDV